MTDIYVYEIASEDLALDAHEILRYLGVKRGKADRGLMQLVEGVSQEAKNSIHGRFVFRILDIEKEKKGIRIAGSTFLLEGKDIARHLKDCNRIALMAVTLGPQIDQKIRYYEQISLDKAVVMDACASAAVEEICDVIQHEIQQIADKTYEEITTRYSPGYGDFPLETQRTMVSLLEASRKLGVSYTDTYILTPRKSVTAAIGLVQGVREKNQYKQLCRSCKKEDACKYKP